MKALRISNQGYKVGNGSFGTLGAGVGTVPQIVHDGDTLSIRLPDNLGVRFLGIDSAEVSMILPGVGKFTNLSDSGWAAHFESGRWREAVAKFNPGLLLHLEAVIGNGGDVAANQARHAERAQRALEASVQADLEKSGKPREAFAFFLAFAHEFLDSTGRLLCYLSSDRYNFDDRKVREEATRLSYNERQLISGAAQPYFIWPNIQPFLGIRPFAPANIRPESFWKMVQRSSKLNQARAAVRAARANGLGVFDPTDPLRLAPFELRYLARGSKPDRYVIDLAHPDTRQLVPPQQYYTIPNPEDRLFIPSDYLPVFQMFGWEVPEI